MISGRKSSSVVGLVALTLGILRCASEPTQIVVDVRATAEECPRVTSTVLRVGTLDDFGAAVSGTKTGCDTGTQTIGTFVLVPKGAEDSEAQFQVVTGIGRAAEQCSPSDIKECIVAKRQVRFEPNRTVRLTVTMTGACRGKICPSGSICNEKGDCIGEATDAGADGADSADAPSETPKQRCDRLCLGDGGGTRACRADGTCEIRCEGGAKCGDVNCPEGMSCQVTCSGTGACQNVSCTGPTCAIDCATGACTGIPKCSGSDVCTIKCVGSNACTGRIECKSKKCALECRSSSSACDGGALIEPTEQQANVVCESDGSCAPLTCNGLGCACQCNPGCWSSSDCTGTCVRPNGGCG